MSNPIWKGSRVPSSSRPSATEAAGRAESRLTAGTRRQIRGRRADRLSSGLRCSVHRHAAIHYHLKVGVDFEIEIDDKGVKANVLRILCTPGKRIGSIEGPGKLWLAAVARSDLKRVGQFFQLFAHSPGVFRLEVEVELKAIEYLQFRADQVYVVIQPIAKIQRKISHRRWLGRNGERACFAGVGVREALDVKRCSGDFWPRRKRKWFYPEFFAHRPDSDARLPMNASRFLKRIYLFMLTALIVCSSPRAGADLSSDRAQCRQNLSNVFDAIQKYRHVHDKLPDRLDDLVPLQLPRADLLFCPAAERDGREAADNSRYYAYEFEPRPLTNELSQNLSVSLRTWRQWQMSRIGSEVPIVRCTNHPTVLNLSFGGAIYESGLNWEDRFSAVVRKEDLSLEKLLADYVRLKVIRIPAREPGTPRELIDLTEHYNGSVKGWLEWPEDNLADLPAGQAKIVGLPFDIRGVIQLGSRAYASLDWPAGASNIVVGFSCPRLVFLQGTVSGEAPGTVIGQYVIHFEDGSRNVFPIRYERQLLDWLTNPGNRRLDNSTAVWSAPSTGGSGRKKVAHLYAIRWTNPQPHLRIHHIDFISARTQSSPFLVAVTAEAAEAPNPKTGPAHDYQKPLTKSAEQRR